MKRLKEEVEERVEKVEVPGVTYYNYLKGKEEFDKSKENLEKQQEEARKNADKHETSFVALLNKAIKDSGLDLEMQLKESLGVYEYNIKDRKELSKVLESLDKVNIKASIKRGVVEGYRYLLQVKAPLTEAKEENPANKKGLRSTRIKAEKGKGLKEGVMEKLFDLSVGNGKEYWTSVFDRALHVLRDDYYENILYNKSDEELRKIAEKCAEEAISSSFTLINTRELFEILQYETDDLEESCKGKKCKKQLKETWAGEDVIDDITERAQMMYDDGNYGDLGDCVTQAIDEGLIYTKDIYSLLEHYGSISDSEIIESFFDELWSDVYNGVEEHEEDDDEDDEDDEDEDIDESKKQECKKKVLEALKKRTFKKGLKESKKLREGQEHIFRFSLGLDVWALVDVEAENYNEAVKKLEALSEEELVQGDDTMIKSASVVGNYDLDWEEPVDDDDDDDDFEDDDYDESLNEGKKKTRLSDEDKNILKSIGYKEEDFKQIEEFMNHMEYRINDKKSSIEEVKKVLDIKDFLSSVARATFHWTTGSEGKNGEDVDFDASRWWRHILKDESLKEKYKGKKSCKKALKESNGYGKEYYEVEEEDFYEDMLKDFSWEDEVEYQFPPLTKEDLKRIYNYNLEVLGKLKGDDKEEQDVLVAGKLEDLVKYADEVLGYALHPDFVYHKGDFDTEDLLECNVKEAIEPVTKEEGIREGKEEDLEESKLNEILITKLQKYVDKVKEELPDAVKEAEEKLEASTSKAEDYAALSVFWNKVMDHAFDNWEDQDIHVLVDDSEAMMPMPESVHKQFVNLLFGDKIKNIDVLYDLDIYDDLLTTGDVGLDDGEYEKLYDELVNNVYFEETEEDKEYEPSADDDIEYNGDIEKVEVAEEEPVEEKPAEEKPAVDAEKELEIKKVLEDRNTFEFESGDYCYVGYEDGKLFAGSATNAGIMREVEIDYDFDESVDANLDRLYNAVVDKHPEYLDF